MVWLHRFILVLKSTTMSKKNKIAVYLTAACLLLLGVSFYPWFTTINLRTEKFSCGFREDIFTLQWIHSVEREIWRETYKAEDDHLLLFRSQFKTFGAGTPYSVYLTTKEGFVESDPNLEMPQIYWMISRNVESTIMTAQGSIPIYQYFDDYSEITLSTQKNTIWTFLKDTCYDKFTASN